MATAIREQTASFNTRNAAKMEKCSVLTSTGTQDDKSHGCDKIQRTQYMLAMTIVQY